MNFASLLADKCLEYFIKNDPPQSGTFSFPFILPPWSLHFKKFSTLCDGCGDCVSVCTNKIIFLGKNGLPAVDFSDGFCTFCGNCAQSCPTGALHFDPKNMPWDLCASISEDCLLKKRVLCRTCEEQCDQEAISFSQTVHEGLAPEILTAQCNGCGACYSTCPADAIFFTNNSSSNIDSNGEQ